LDESLSGIRDYLKEVFMQIDTSREKAKFAPITLVITIENERELDDLLARTNACHSHINENSTIGHADEQSSWELWKVLKSLKGI
jgi:hypothetical protein